VREVAVGDAPAHWVPLLRWPDGSLALVQLQWREQLRAEERWRLPVRMTPSAAEPEPAPAFEGASPWPEDLPVRFEVVDPWQGVHVARLRQVETLDAGMVRRRRYRGTPASAHGSTLFEVEVIASSRGSEPFGELTVVLDNGRSCRDVASGPARLRRFTLVTEDVRLRLRPRWARELLLPLPTPERDEQGVLVGYRQDLFPASDQLYLGDGTAKAFRFDACWDDGRDAAELTALAALCDRPPMAFADLEWVRATGAFGLFGGPAPLASRSDDLAAAAVGAFHAVADFGPFGAFGVPRAEAPPGGAHHTPGALHGVVRWHSSDLLRIAEAQVLQGALRPLPGRRPRLPPETATLRAGLSQRALRHPHGFEPLGYEHATVDLLFAFYWLTGDPFALDELRRHGAAIRELLQRLPFQTSRGEGTCAQALAAVSWATADDELAAWAVRRAHEQVLPRLDEWPAVAIAQPPHPDVLGGSVAFDAPWQMALLVHGLAALHRRTGDAALARAAVEVARRMATHGWVEGQGPKYFVHARDPATYCFARGVPPLLGSARMAAGAFVLASELCRDDDGLRELLARRAAAIVDAARGEDGLVPPAVRADPWLQVPLDRAAR